MDENEEKSKPVTIPVPFPPEMVPDIERAAAVYGISKVDIIRIGTKKHVDEILKNVPKAEQ